MRKVLLSLLVLALAAPTFAAVNISIVDNENGTATLVIDTTSGEVVRGVALKVTATDGATLVSTAATVNPVFNTFIDAAFELGGAYNIGDGQPFAKANEAGTAAAGATEFSISMGVLDQAGNQAGYTSPVGGEALITFETGAGTICVALDTLRGGIVGDAAIVSNLDAAAVCSPVTILPTDCWTGDAASRLVWESVGKPEGWCKSVNPRQCKGDADGLSQGKNNWWVSTNDLGVLVAAWNKPYAEIAGQQTNGVDLINADFDRTPQGKNNWRVSTNDLGILVANWNQNNAPAAICQDVIGAQ
jgi:hypothetical protein